MKLAILLLAAAVCRCAAPPKDFDANRYKGVWYELARTKNAFFEKGEKVKSVYRLNSAGGFAAEQSSVQANGQRHDSLSVLEPVGDLPGHFSFYYPRNRFSKFLRADYRVIDTDYDNYAIILSKNRFAFWDVDFAWIFTRKAQLPADAVEQLFDRLTALTGIKKYELHRTIQ